MSSLSKSHSVHSAFDKAVMMLKAGVELFLLSLVDIVIDYRYN